jgi:hypothetical protein
MSKIPVIIRPESDEALVRASVLFQILKQYTQYDPYIVPEFKGWKTWDDDTRWEMVDTMIGRWLDGRKDYVVLMVSRARIREVPTIF